MTIEQAVVLLLKGDDALTSLVEGRVFPQAAPQDERSPCVLYVVSDSAQLMTVNGFIDLSNCGFRFDCYGAAEQGYASAKRVAKALRNRLFGFLRGEVADPATGETLTVQGFFDDGGEDGLEPPIHGEDRGLDYVGVGVRAWWNEPDDDE